MFSLPTAPVLYRVPAGYQLEFQTPPGHYAEVYRRVGAQSWECIAHHACSPCLDRTALGCVPCYYVQYRNTQGAIVGRTSVLHSAPDALPSHTCWLHLF